MSQRTRSNNQLLDLVTRFAESYREDKVDERLLAEINDLLPRITSADDLCAVAERLWTDLAPWYDIPTMMRLLRRWRELEPASKAAKETLGTFLLMHGPDWDEEGQQLLAEARQASN